jgi:septal ring factor EnvC (AmiA/AmiB activator)
MTSTEILLQIILPLLGGESILGTVVVGILNKRKVNAEANKLDIDRVAVTIENSMKIEQLSTDRYLTEVEKYKEAMKQIDALQQRAIDLLQTINDLLQTINDIRSQLRETHAQLEVTQQQLENSEKYVTMLVGVLTNNNMEIPLRPQIEKK